MAERRPAAQRVGCRVVALPVDFGLRVPTNAVAAILLEWPHSRHEVAAMIVHVPQSGIPCHAWADGGCSGVGGTPWPTSPIHAALTREHARSLALRGDAIDNRETRDASAFLLNYRRRILPSQSRRWRCMARYAKRRRACSVASQARTASAAVATDLADWSATRPVQSDRRGPATTAMRRKPWGMAPRAPETATCGLGPRAKQRRAIAGAQGRPERRLTCDEAVRAAASLSAPAPADRERLGIGGTRSRSRSVSAPTSRPGP